MVASARFNDAFPRALSNFVVLGFASKNLTFSPPFPPFSLCFYPQQYRSSSFQVEEEKEKATFRLQFSDTGVSFSAFTTVNCSRSGVVLVALVSIY